MARSAYLLAAVVLAATACSPGQPESDLGADETAEPSLRFKEVEGEWSGLEPVDAGMTVGVPVADIVPRTEDLTQVAGAWSARPEIAGSLNGLHLLPSDCFGDTERTIEDSVSENKALEVFTENGSTAIGISASATRYADPRIARFLVEKEWTAADDSCFGRSLVEGVLMEPRQAVHQTLEAGRERSSSFVMDVAGSEAGSAMDIQAYCAAVADVLICVASLELGPAELITRSNHGEAWQLLREMVNRAEQSLQEYE